MSAVAGVLVTAMVTPALAVTGMAANSSISVFENLPEYIKPDALSQTSSIYATNPDGSEVLLASFYDQNRQNVGWNQISQYFKDAIISTEDPRFYVHGGLDIQSTLRALASNAISNDIQSGASTISQQYVKNILVQRAEAISDPTARQAAYDEATATTADRKLKEMKLAIGLEKEYTKDDILLGYMNIALFGGQVYGIQAASRYYFNVNADALTLPQAASLAAMVNEPEGLRIDVSAEKTQANKDRRDKDILPSMLKEHTITQAQFDEAVATPVTPTITPASTGCQTAGNGAGFFCDYVKSIIEQDPAFGATQDDRSHALSTGGYKIMTTLNTTLQAAANTAVTDWVPASSSALNIGGTMVSVEPGTGKVLAMAQNRPYDPSADSDGVSSTAINYNTDQAYGGSSGFQPGSTFKLFTLIDWLQKGHSLGDIVNGTNNQLFTGANVTNSCGDTVGSYRAGNDAGEAGGRASVLTQFEESVNNAFLSMATQLDLCDINKVAASLGIHPAQTGGTLNTGLYGTVLGGNEIAPLTMAAAYAAMANKGIFCTPVAISSITDASGANVDVPQTQCTQAVDPGIATAVNYAMQGVVQSGTAAPANPADGTPHFGKTGTSDGEQDVWLVGGTTKVVSASWVGNVTGKVSIRRTTVTGGNGTPVPSGYSRLYVWKQFYKTAADALGGDSFPTPASQYLRAQSATVPTLTGLTIDQAQAKLTASGFGFTDGGQVDSNLPAGQVASSDPAGGSSAPRNSTVTVYTSNGKQTTQNLPDVRGQQAEQAVLALAGWSVVQVPSTTKPCAPGTVVDQSPGEGPAVQATTTVTLSICPEK